MTKTQKITLLHAKWVAYRETGGKDINFTTPEMWCLCNRWSASALPSAPDNVKAMCTVVIEKKRWENEAIAKA